MCVFENCVVVFQQRVASFAVDQAMTARVVDEFATARRTLVS